MQNDTNEFIKKDEPIKSPEQIAHIIQAILESEDENDKHKEHLFGIGLSASLQVQYIELVTMGTLDRTPVDNQDLLSFATQKRCPYFIVAHNHNGEELLPGKDDIQVTLKLGVGAYLVGITLIDHVIVNENDYYSFGEHELIHDYEGAYQVIQNVTEDVSEKIIERNLEKVDKQRKKITNYETE